jgi:actin-like ATPase involved in cell morphogenesis
MTYTLGLDLGTTYTAAATCRDGRCEISPLGNRSAVVPSVVHLGADGTTLVGEAAQRRLTTEPLRVAREFKRRIGDPTPLLLGGSPIAAEALTARLAKAVVANVTEREGTPPARVTVTHPATWGPFKLDLLAQAMRMADLTGVGYLSEPEAAAWEYAASRSLTEGSTIAVYDLGGGTFDATILRADADGFALLGEPEGIERLGGIDIDQAVFAFVVAALDGAVEALDPDDPVAMSSLSRLRADCTEAKEALSSDHEAAVAVVLPTVHTEIRITRPELEALIRPVMGDTVAAMRRALQSAGVTADGLDAVLLVGGSSRIPLVGEVVGELLGRPVAVDAHPKHLVAMGAARHAAADGRLDLLTAPVRHAATPSPAPVAAPVSPEPVPPGSVPPEPVSPGPGPLPTPSAPPDSPVPAPHAVAGPAAAAIAASETAAQAAPRGTVDHDDHPPSTSRGPRSRIGLLAGIGAMVVAVVVGAVLALSGGGGGAGDGDGGAGGGDQAAAGCPSTGPFVCITDVAPANGGGLVATFAPVDVTPGASGTSLVFFLADISRNDHGVSVVTAGLPLEWRSTDPFSGWTDAELATRSVVCAGVVRDGGFLPGSGNCRDLP